MIVPLVSRFGVESRFELAEYGSIISFVVVSTRAC